MDHIEPVSRGGLSIPENLQTLCWRSNRSKSNKTSPTASAPVAQQVTPPALPTTAVGVVRPESVAATAPRAVTTSEVEGRLVKLRELYEAGLFTDAEYEAKKKDLLNRS